MIIDANKDTIPIIRNLYLLHHVLARLLLFEDLKAEVTRIGLKVDEYSYEDEIEQRLKYLMKHGAHFRNNSKSIYINRLSPGCTACEKGIGELILNLIPSCDIDCKHCRNDLRTVPAKPITDYIGTIDAFAAEHEVLSVALSGTEPLLQKQHAIECLRFVQESFPGAYKRLHTSGDLLDRDILGELHRVGLDEIRFIVKEVDIEAWGAIKSRLSLAKELIPRVVVEMSVVPGTLERMKSIVLQLDEMGIFGINLCELCYCMHHADEMIRRSCRVRFPPFKIPYFSRMQHTVIPIARSDLESYDLLRFALDKGITIGVHYCSVENRMTSRVYGLNHGWGDDPIGHFSHRDFYIKSAMACGDEDIQRVLRAFGEQGIREHRLLDGRVRCLEFPVSRIPTLKGMNIQLGIASSVMEPPGLPGGVWDDGLELEMKSGTERRVRRVVKIDFTSPDLFDLETDV